MDIELPNPQLDGGDSDFEEDFSDAEEKDPSEICGFGIWYMYAQ